MNKSGVNQPLYGQFKILCTTAFSHYTIYELLVFF